MSEIRDLNTQAEEQIRLFNDDLRQLIEVTEEVENKYVEPAAIFFGISIALSVIVNVLVLAMLVVVYFSSKGVENICTRVVTYALLWPIFIFFLVLFWVFALLFLVTSLAGSDFCVKPDAVVSSLLYQYQDRFSSLIFGFLMYWISGCNVDYQPDINALGPIQDFVETVHDLSETILNLSPQSLESQCGLDSAAATALQGGAGLLHNATHLINRAWIETRHLVECKTFNPIYTTFVHDAVCQDGVDGLTWLFSSSMFLAMFAMLMIMFRAALHPVKRPPTLSESLGLNASLLSKSGN